MHNGFEASGPCVYLYLDKTCYWESSLDIDNEKCPSGQDEPVKGCNKHTKGL